MDTVELCNTILYYLKQYGHADDLINTGKLTNTAWLINVIYTIRHNESALAPEALADFQIGLYGPFSKKITDTFDPLDMYDTDYSPRLIKNSIQDHFLIRNGNAFDVKIIPFEYLTIPKPVREIIEQYTLLIWEIDNFDLAQLFQQEPQLKSGKKQIYETNYRLSDSVNYFKSEKNILKMLNTRKKA